MRIKRPHSNIVRRPLASLIGLLALTAVPLAGHAEDYFLETGEDTVVSDASNGSPSCAVPCSLRAAIVAANANPGRDTIHLGDYDISLYIQGSDENSGITGDLDITGNLTIIGEKSDGTLNKVDAGGLYDRAFQTLGNANVKFENMSIINGSVTDSGGGAIHVRDTSHLDLVNVEMSGNKVTTSKTTFETTGGAIYVDLSASATIVSSTFTDNSAPAGGAINNAGRTEVRNSVLENNSANKNLNGGAINNAGGFLVIGNSTLNDNTASQSGGALYSANLGENLGSVVVTNTEFSNNFASAHGGAIANLGPMSINNSSLNNNESKFDGGGIYNSAIGNVELTNSTVSKNKARSGGGLFTTRVASVTNSTIYNNMASACTIACNDQFSKNGVIGGNQIAIFTASGSSQPDVTLVNTIIANGPASDPNDTPCAGDSGYERNITTIGHNLETADSCGLISNYPLNDQINVVTPGLLDLEIDSNYPNTTSVHPLANGSPAIDAGDSNECPKVDQRFLERDSNCDIGAYEEGASQQLIGDLVDLKVTISDSPDPVAPNNDNQPLNYSIAVSNLYVDTAAEDVFVEIALPSSFWFDTLRTESTSASPVCEQPNSSNILNCSVSSIPGLGMVGFYISGYPTVTGTIELTVNVYSSTVDAYLNNNRNITETTTVDNTADDTDNFGGGSSRRGGGSSDLLLLAFASVVLVGRRYLTKR